MSAEGFLHSADKRDREYQPPKAEVNADREQEIRAHHTMRRTTAESNAAVRDLLAAFVAERALRQQAEQERDQLRQAFDTEVRVCSARTDMLDASRGRVARLEQALTEVRALTRHIQSAPWGRPDQVQCEPDCFGCTISAVVDAALAGDAETKASPYETITYRCPKCGMPEVCDDPDCPDGVAETKQEPPR